MKRRQIAGGSFFLLRLMKLETKLNHLPSGARIFRGAAFHALCGLTLLAQSTLPTFVVEGRRVANDSSVGTIDMPVSALRFEPRADVQSRNLAEAQADVSIRGGTFESTGLRVGAATLGDSQTGHYLTELPIAPAMLTAPRILTGSDNAAAGFNAGAGSIALEWREIETAATVSAAAGNFGFNRQAIHAGAKRALSGGALGADVEWARSESDGSRPAGDHDFGRVAGRVQWRTRHAQTDLFAGYQSKFFGWPNLYTPFGFNETENLQTALALLNHRWEDGHGNSFSAAAVYRRNKDDYEFNRAIPGASNPFQHTTWMRGAAVSGRVKAGRFALNYAGDLLADRLKSTALTFGRYNDRVTAKLTALPELSFARPDGAEVLLRAGASYDDSNRHGSAVSPLARVEWRAGAWSAYVDYSAATQLPSYTALNSAATAGLFRGNPNLGRTTSRNIELGARALAAGWQWEAAVFEREDDELVDWTFRRGVVARTANAVDIRVRGAEILLSRRTERLEFVLGYAWLEKDASYGSALVDASFYALNFPVHRATAAITWRLGAGLELRSDNEYRVQEKNPLRTLGGDTALLSSVGLYYRPAALPGWAFSVLVDNVWDDDFQEVPAVPSARRQWAAGVTRRW